MEALFIFLGIITAYFLGSVPVAVWFGQLYHGIDLRKHGSKNPGATNTFRVLGKRAGIVVLLVDVMKGLIAASIPVLLLKFQFIPENQLVSFKLLFGMMAVLGHLFPVFLKFRGGKGVATLFGMMLAVHYEVALLCVLIFIIVLVMTKYVSLSSILGSLAFPCMLLLIPRFQGGEPLLIIFGFILFAVIVVRHNKNIQRLLKGEESKTYLFNRKNNSN